MRTTRRCALALAIAAASITTAFAQMPPGKTEVGGIYDEEKHAVSLSDANWRIGLGIGPSIATNAKLIADFRAQERLYARRQFNESIQAELGVGIHRVAGNYLTDDEYDSHVWSFDVRGLFAPSLNDQWNPYGFAGLGYAIYRIIEAADDAVFSEVDVSGGEIGGGLVVPLGVGMQFKPERHARIAIDMGIGYSMIFDDRLDGERGGSNASFINGLVALEYLFHDVVAQRQGIVPAE